MSGQNVGFRGYSVKGYAIGPCLVYRGFLFRRVSLYHHPNLKGKKFNCVISKQKFKM